ncbi:MAG: histone deacetylase [Proteobacteria bacterium]|nr:MAG: histone deacetylase [Pseudomonadota bacterium]
MKVFYSDSYTIDLPDAHRFPMSKYKMLRNYLLDQQILTLDELTESPLASEELLKLAHTEDYVNEMRDGTIDPIKMKRVGFPWSVELYNRSRASVGGTIEATKVALKEGFAGNLAGGTHHAHRDAGEGYCVFNDIAVATRYLQQKALAQRIAVIDLDVHQGDGNSSILASDPSVFVFSMHGEKNFPFRKVPSDLDIALPDGTEDEAYLEQLQAGLKAVERFQPEYIFYQMGVDPLKEDTLGKLSLTFAGLMSRDELVFQFARRLGLPISLALGGGYAKPIELSVEAYANTYRVLKRVYDLT